VILVRLLPVGEAVTASVCGRRPTVHSTELDDFFVMDFAWLIDRRAVDLIKMLVKVAGHRNFRF
jgi:hypothetical protein